MERPKIDWLRIKKSLLQDAEEDNQKIDDILYKLIFLAGECGEITSSRRMLNHIGKILITQNPITVLTPCCQTLNSGSKLLVERHVVFLKKVAQVIPVIAPIFLIASHEAEDVEFCLAVGKTQGELQDAALQSLKDIHLIIEPLGWRTALMSETIPDLIKQENEAIKWIAGKKEFKSRLVTETASRKKLYHSIYQGKLMTMAEQIQRTIKTAAQYIVMGNFAAQNNFLVCNHTTTNLSWYLQTEAAVLHNPISPY